MSDNIMGMKEFRSTVGLDLKMFKYGNSFIRAFYAENKMWYVLNDVAQILGISNSDLKYRCSREDDKCIAKTRSVFKRNNVGATNLVVTEKLVRFVCSFDRVTVKASENMLSWLDNENKEVVPNFDGSILVDKKNPQSPRVIIDYFPSESNIEKAIIDRINEAPLSDILDYFFNRKTA